MCILLFISYYLPSPGCKPKLSSGLVWCNFGGELTFFSKARRLHNLKGQRGQRAHVKTSCLLTSCPHPLSLVSRFILAGWHAIFIQFLYLLTLTAARLALSLNPTPFPRGSQKLCQTFSITAHTCL